jgi:hypothetical protein
MRYGAEAILTSVPSASRNTAVQHTQPAQLTCISVVEGSMPTSGNHAASRQSPSSSSSTISRAPVSSVSS